MTTIVTEAAHKPDSPGRDQYAIALSLVDQEDATAYAYRPEPQYRWIEQKLNQTTTWINLLLLFTTQLLPLVVATQVTDGFRLGALWAATGLPVVVTAILVGLSKRRQKDFESRFKTELDTYRTALSKAFIQPDASDEAGASRKSEVEDARLATIHKIANGLEGNQGKRDLFFYAPLGHRFLWWWTLFLSLSALAGGQLSTLIKDANATLDYTLIATDVVRALLISVVAYIASNIIRELLTLRNQYASAQSEVGRFGEKLATHRRSLEKSTREVEKSTKGVAQELTRHRSMLRVVRRFNKLGAALERIRQRLADDPQQSEKLVELEDEVFNQYVNSLTANAESLLDQYGDLADSVKKEHRLFLGATVTAVLQEQRARKDGYPSYLVRLSTLAKIACELYDSVDHLADALKGAEPSPEFACYAHLAIPPQRFLNKGMERGGPVVGDSNWEHFLRFFARNAQCRTHVPPHVPMHRFLLSVVTDDRGRSEAKLAEFLQTHGRECLWWIGGMEPEEAVTFTNDVLAKEFGDLEARDVSVQLNKWKVALGEAEVDPKDARDHPARKYYIALKDLSEPSGEKTVRYDIHQREAEGTPLGTVLGRTYHKEGRLKVAEILDWEALSWLQDPNTGKPFDYFAIRARDKWIFCLRSLYDSDLDVADVQIRTPDGSEAWERLEQNLDRLYCPDKATMPLTTEHQSAETYKYRG